MGSEEAFITSISAKSRYVVKLVYDTCKEILFLAVHGET
jgi:hypothetical protein